MIDNGLIIFIKNPVLGKVKTRIAKGSSDKVALAVYHKLLDHTRKISLLVDAKKYLYYSDNIDSNDQWPETAFQKLKQRGVELGERMLDAFIEVLSYQKKAVIIGSDCIYLKTSHIQEAFSELDHFDVVIGPAVDGGYYLLGCKKAHLDLFLNMPWSTGRELNESLLRIKNMGLSCVLLEELNDIDHIKDWEQYLMS